MRNHESALLVVLAYIIGFITAFIMFNLVEVKKHETTGDVPRNNEGALVADTPSGVTEVMETNEGLFVKTGETERIVSAFSEEASGPGFHADISLATVSSDGAYVHYCAALALESENCQHFIYSVAEDKTYMVKSGDEILETPTAEASMVSWVGNSSLSYSDQSASSDSMWTLR